MSKNPEQKIDCNVLNCMHNNSKDCACELETIQVCPCNTKGSKNFEDETACAMYTYQGKK